MQEAGQGRAEKPSSFPENHKSLNCPHMSDWQNIFLVHYQSIFNNSTQRR